MAKNLVLGSTNSAQSLRKKSFLKYFVVIASVFFIGAICFSGCQFVSNWLSGNLDLSLIPTTIDDKYGYIDHKGTYVINPQFKSAEYFSCGLARVENSEGKVGYIDKDGKYVINPTYKDGTTFSENRAFVVPEGGSIMCIDKKGNKIFDLEEAQEVTIFSEGLAAYKTVNEKGETKWGYVNNKGKVVINPQFNSASIFSEGRALIQNDKDEYGYIDEDGKIVINPQFDEANIFSNGLACVRSGEKWGFIDRDGKYVVNPQFDAAGNFSNNLAPVLMGDKCGFINDEGKIIINPQFDVVGEFSEYEDLSWVSVDDKYGFIDKKGIFVINPQFESASDFWDDFAIVSIGDKYGLIDKKGNFTVNPQFEMLFSPVDLITLSIESDYYDATSFLNDFLANASSSSIDGFTNQPTLGDLFSHPIYGKDIKNNLMYSSASFKRKHPYNSEITLDNVEFSFSSSTYENRYSYDYYWDVNIVKEYHKGSQVNMITYKFDLSGFASRHYRSIAKSFISRLEKIYQAKSKTEYNAPSEAIVYSLQNNTIHFILCAEMGEINLIVIYDKELFDNWISLISNLNNEHSRDSSYDVAEEVVVEEAVAEEAVEDYYW